jgi:hypothetical protein
MRVPITLDDALRLGRFALAVEGVALLVALALGAVLAVARSMRLLDAFLLAVFAIFVLLLFFAVLSGPGLFLSRPRLAPLGRDATGWRGWLRPPPIGADREFYELVLYVGLAFLLLGIATGIARVVEALGG